MQAKLPDVNAAIVRYRSQALEAARNPDTYDMAIISLSALNADLPEDFKVEVNSQKYYSLIEDRRYILCSFCTEVDKNENSSTFGKKIPTECIFADVEKYEIDLDWKEQILSGKQKESFWVCTKCGVANVLDTNSVKIKKYQMPFYTKIMPEPPSKKRGIQGRTSYENEFKIWFGIALQEMENQISKYRTEYEAQQETEEAIVMEP